MTAKYSIATKISEFNVTAKSFLENPPHPKLRPLAISWYKKSLALAPNHEATLLALARAHYRLGDYKNAIRCSEDALAHHPTSLAAHYYSCMFQIPIVYQHTDEITSSREAYHKMLLAFYEKIKEASDAAVLPLADAIGTVTPFYLIYSDQDDKQHQELYGNILTAIMARCYPSASNITAKQQDGRITVGIPFGFFRQHSVWKVITRGWLSQLDKQKFRIIGYSLGNHHDAQTEIARNLCEKFIAGTHSTTEWIELIKADAPDILIYPEVSMHRLAIQLSALRLAPVQCTTWGTYVTSGLPTIDYYLSGALIEPEHAKQQYMERLITLPDLSIYYTPPEAIPSTLTRADLGLPADATLYLCIQSLFKYLPAYDFIYPTITQSVKNCHFVFLKSRASTAISEQFFQRLHRAFEQAGLNIHDHVTMLSSLSDEQYHRMHELADVFLDSIGTGGTTTTLEALSSNIPIITLPSNFLRGRVSSGILNHLGIKETIATSVENYIELAITLGNQPTRRQQLRAQMERNKVKAYQNTACTTALEAFISSAVSKNTQM